MTYERRSFGKYHVLARLGRGGMGQVLLAMHAGPAGVQKLVVVKQLREDLASVPAARSMFLDEARVATLLHHPNIVQTYEVVDEGEDLYIVMEFLDGRPLSRVLGEANRARFSLPMRLRMVADTLAALHYAHERADYDGTPLGVVHRDVSPQNVFVTYDGHVKLVDFGIAKASNATTITASGVFKGKVRYAAPEQVLGLDVDRRADVFAVGAVLWEALTDQRMWPAAGDATVLFELASGHIPRPGDVRADLPPELEAICSKAIARAPKDRFATAAEMRHAILEYLVARHDPTTEDEIAASMMAAFAEKRREVQALVEAQAKAVREGTAALISAPSFPRLSVDSFTPAPGTVTGMSGIGSLASPGSHGSHGSQGATPPRSDAPLAQTLAPPPAKSRAPVASVLAFVGGVCALVGAGVVLRMAPSRFETPGVTGAAAARAEERVHVLLRAEPRSARLFLDGAALITNPYEADVPRDGTPHVLSVRAEGFETREMPVHLARDLDVDVALVPAIPAVSLAQVTRGVPPSAHAAPARPQPGHSQSDSMSIVNEPRAVPPHRSIDEDDPYESDNPYDPRDARAPKGTE